MSKIRLFILAGLSVLVTLLVVYLVYGYNRYPNMPFKCTTFTVYDLSSDRQTLILRLSQDLRLQDRDSGYFLVKGTTLSQGTTSVVNRMLNLKEGEQVDSDTYRYRISDVTKSPNDTLSDALFEQWLSEITTRPGVFQIDVVKGPADSWLIGSPVSFLFTCRSY